MQEQIITPSKRAQVPKACGNCRKMHSGCDMERPCKRCVQNNLQSSCHDIPRKKRVSKKREKQTEKIKEQDKPLSPQNSQNTRTIWEENKEISPISTLPTISPISTPQIGSTSLSPSTLFNPEIPFRTETINYIPDFPDDYRSPLSRPPPDFAPSSLSTSDIVFLFQQIVELKENNKQLERKLGGVTQELGNMKFLKPSINSEWHTLQPQNELAISVWKNVGLNKKYILVECNEKFVKLLGYPIDILCSDFSWNKLIQREPEDPKKESKGYPMCTKITTATGLKDVFITINPVSDHTTVKFYVLHILDTLTSPTIQNNLQF